MKKDGLTHKQRRERARAADPSVQARKCMHEAQRALHAQNRALLQAHCLLSQQLQDARRECSDMRDRIRSTLVGVMVVFSFALTTVSKLPLWHMHMKYSASELLSAGLKTITMGGVFWGAEARSVKATMHYMVMGCDACTTAANIGGLFSDAAEAAAFVVAYVLESHEKIQVFGANDVHVHQDNRIVACMSAHEGMYLWTVDAFLKTLAPSDKAQHWLASPGLEKHQLLLIGSTWRENLDVQAYAVKFTSASGCGQVALMRVERSVTDVLHAIPIM